MIEKKTKQKQKQDEREKTLAEDLFTRNDLNEDQTPITNYLPWAKRLWTAQKKELWQRKNEYHPQITNSHFHKVIARQIKRKEERENISQKKRKSSCSKKSTKSTLTNATIEETPKGLSQFFLRKQKKQKPKWNNQVQDLVKVADDHRKHTVSRQKKTHLYSYNWRGSRTKKNRSWRRKGYRLKIANFPKQSTGTEISWQINGAEN